MANAVVTLFIVAVLLTGALGLAQSSFVSMDLLADSWKQMEVRTGDIARTQLQTVSTSLNGSYVDVTLRNTGQTPLRGFDAWDVAVQYYRVSGTYYQVWLPYTTSLPPGSNQWTVEGIYIDAATSTAEAFAPGILDPEEEIVIRLKLSPVADGAANNQVVIGTANGVSITAMF